MVDALSPTMALRDFVRQYIALNKVERFEKVPHGRYINFVAEFLAADKGGDACRGNRCVERAQEVRHPQRLRVLGQGAREAQGKEQVTSVALAILVSPGIQLR
jgi:hypothetical protein